MPEIKQMFVIGPRRNSVYILHLRLMVIFKPKISKLALCLGPVYRLSQELKFQNALSHTTERDLGGAVMAGFNSYAFIAASKS